MRFFILLILAFLSALPAHGAASESTLLIQAESAQNIQQILKEIHRSRTQLAQIKSRIAKPSGKDKEILSSLEETRVQLESQILTLNQSLEQLATGNANIDLFKTDVAEQKFNWKSELQEVLKPMMSEVKRVTKQSRQIEELRSKKEELEEKLTAASTAMNSIDKYYADNKKIADNAAFKSLREKWHLRHENINNELALISFQLQQKAQEQKQQGTPIWRSLRQFSTGRGLNILIAISAFVFTFVSLKLGSIFLARFVGYNRSAKERKFYYRFLALVSQALSLAFALLSIPLALLFLGDYLLLTLIGLGLLLFIFALRNSLPNYFEEMKTLMNLGAARENERVLFQGLPWILSRIHIYCTLTNPALTGAKVRLPLKMVAQMTSRQSSKNESWFPTAQGDFVVLDDGVYGSVHIQTPDVVVLTMFGGSRKVYPTREFLDNSPRNLSYGFGIQVNFKLSPNLQASITSDAIPIMEQSVNDRFEKSQYATCVNSILVEFQQASLNSLDLAIIVMFNSQAAKSYYQLGRFMNTIAIDTCNENDWKIPFSQISVHSSQN